MCLDRGAKPSIAKFKQQVHQRNLDHLTVWQNVGRDVENGIWAILGARMGTYMLMITPEWDYRNVQSFDALEKIFSTIDGHDPEQIAARISSDLITQLNLPVVMLDEASSKFFKDHQRKKYINHAVMTREIDVIRRQEGW